MENNHIEIIGVDHGFSMMKTVSKVFTSGVGEITSEPAIYENLLEYQKRYFRIGGEMVAVTNWITTRLKLEKKRQMMYLRWQFI